MFNVLVVDDDVVAVEGIKAMIDQKRNNIDNIYSAYNISSAKRILEDGKIDALICDIEMPGGSGIELMEWVNKTDPHIVSVFLTSYADFSYAKRAIELKIFKYLLKPVDEELLNQVIEEGLKQYIEKTRTEKQVYAAREILIRKILSELLDGIVRSDKESIMKKAEHDGVEEFFEKFYYIVLISAKNLSEENEMWKISLLEYAVCNIATEIFSTGEKNAFIYRRSQLEFFLFCSDLNDVRKRAKELIEWCNTYLHLKLCCYIGNYVKCEDFSETMQALLKIENDNVSYENQSFTINEDREILESKYKFDMNAMMFLMNSGKFEDVYNKMISFIDYLVQNREMNNEMLKKIFFDFTQVIYVFLNEKQIQAYLIFSTERSREYFDKGRMSVFNFKKYVKYVLTLIDEQLKFMSNEKSMVDRVIEYIHQNLDKSLTRETVSSYVFLNPDHLTRLMKKKTGMSISAYITYARVEYAKELLISTELSVMDIAVATGFPYYTYFSVTFKKATGVSPTDYRKKLKKDKTDLEEI